jgi:hypothetical protein
MDLEEFKVGWKKQEATSYSEEELKGIYHLRESRTLAELSSGLTWDLILALIISALFIIVLQVAAFQTSNFWSLCMGILAFQHLVFYQYQRRLIKKYSSYTNNVFQSIDGASKRLKRLLWFYRLWPASLTLILFVIYINQFDPLWPLLQVIMLGLGLAISIALLSNKISAVLVRKHYYKLKKLSKELRKQIKENP